MLQPSDLLDAWERAAATPAPVRGVAVLSVALPQQSAAELLELTLGQRDRLLIELLAGSFTPVIDGLTDCAECGEPIEVTIGCEQLLATSPSRPPTPLVGDGWRVEWRPPNSADLLAARAAADEQAAEQIILSRCVLAASGIEASQVRSELAQAIEQGDPLADVRIEIHCPECGREQEVPLDVSDFLWREIAGRAVDLVRDVATLARAYGWTEPDVLALSPARRQAYLELANG